MKWTEFDYYDTEATAPPAEELVWVVDTGSSGVTAGYFDGFTFRLWSGTDDCEVTHWAEIEYPAAPGTDTGEAAR